MKRKSVYSLIKENWWELIIIFCVFFGSGLIFSTKHIFPVFLDLLAFNLRESGEAADQSKNITVRVTSLEPDYRYYFPIVSNHDIEEEHALGEEPWQHPFIEINFDDGTQPITIVVDPANNQNHSKTPVEISFLPGKHCIFGDGYACVYQFLSSAGRRVIFVSVHSGTGGEGDDFRNLLEGTGINRGLFDSQTVLDMARSLSGSAVKIKQGDKKIEELTLTSITRIPPEHFETYTALPIEEALDYVMTVFSLDPGLLTQDLLVIETCGWRLPDEAHFFGLEDTSSSVYLGFINLFDEGSKRN